VTMLDALAAPDTVVVRHVETAAANLLPLPAREELPRRDVLLGPFPRWEPGGLWRAFAGPLAGSVLASQQTVTFYADMARRRLANQSWLPADVEPRVRWASFARSILGLWTTGCGVVIPCRSIRWQDMPRFVVRVLP
jgi:hypothetical protein